MGDWDPARYLRFSEERGRPCRDLLARLAELTPSSVLDVGCGPGNSTAQLAAAFPAARVCGIDASEEMLKKARAACPGVSFVRAAVPGGLSALGGQPFDLIFSNACLQWIPEPEAVLSALAGRLSPEGTLAVQIPLVQQAAFYRVLRALTAPDGAWARLSAVYPFHVREPEWYYDCLCRRFSCVQLWTTVYYHTVDSVGGVLDWYRGSGLRPYLDALDEAEREPFLSALQAALSADYPVRENGAVLLPMPRLFFIAEGLRAK